MSVKQTKPANTKRKPNRGTLTKQCQQRCDARELQGELQGTLREIAHGEDAIETLKKDYEGIKKESEREDAVRKAMQGFFKGGKSGHDRIRYAIQWSVLAERFAILASLPSYRIAQQLMKAIRVEFCKKTLVVKYNEASVVRLVACATDIVKNRNASKYSVANLADTISVVVGLNAPKAKRGEDSPALALAKTRLASKDCCDAERDAHYASHPSLDPSKPDAKLISKQLARLTSDVSDANPATLAELAKQIKALLTPPAKPNKKAKRKAKQAKQAKPRSNNAKIVSNAEREAIEAKQAKQASKAKPATLTSEATKPATLNASEASK